MNVKMDARPAAEAYSKAFQHFKELPGFDAKEVLRAEMGSILKRWAGDTKVAKPFDASLRARYSAGKRAFGYTNIARNPYGISVNTGRRGSTPGDVWYRHPASKKFQQAGTIDDSGRFTPSWIHWKDPVWANINAGAQLYGDQLKVLLPAAQRSIGFARQSVVQIADALGIDLVSVKGQGISAAGVAKARAAIASNGRAYSNGSGSQGGDTNRCYIEALNRLPFGTKLGMDASLARILAGRAAYIETSYRKGAFDSMKSVGRAFPNLVNTSGLSTN